MSRYTTELRFICEDSIPLSEQGDFTDVDKAIECGRKRIFTFNYNLFDEDYKPVIETKFLRHFYTREIGMETFALWKLKLRDLWEMKLPYYNKLWESELIKFDPFRDVDYKVINTGDRWTNNNTNGTSNKTNESNLSDKTKNTYANKNERNENLINKFSDTPQGGLDGVIEDDWLSTATQDVNKYSGGESGNNVSDKNTKTSENENVKTSNASNIHDIDDYERHIVGKMGLSSYPKLLQEFRDSFLNIDEMFINEMNGLFMLIY